MNESEFLEELVDKYYEHIKDNEKVVVACTGYDNQTIPAPRLIDTVSFNNKVYYILGCKYGDGIEIYRDFKYKGEAIPIKYGGCLVENGKSFDVWSLNISKS
jgi:hypothetical protein